MYAPDTKLLDISITLLSGRRHKHFYLGYMSYIRKMHNCIM